MPDSSASPRWSWGAMPLIFCMWVALSLFSGWAHYLMQKAGFASQISEQLASVANLKVAQIVAWNLETKADMEVLFRSPIMDSLQQYLAHPNDENARRDLQRWMESECRYQGYKRVALVGNPGRILLSVPESTNDPSWSEDHFTPLLQATNVIFNDLHRHRAGGDIHLNYWIPVGPHPGRLADGLLLIEIDPGRYLYPLLEQWPMPSQTAETLIVRREGDSVVFLNNLRHKPKSALDLRLSMKARPDAPSVRAVSGYVGAVEGPDYRGVPVLAEVRPVSGTPWFMVSKMDKDEVFAPLRHRAWMVGIGTAILMLTGALAFWLMLGTRETGFLKRQLAAERESQMLAKRVLYLSQHANDIILLADGNWRIVDANNRGLEAYGYSLDEIRKVGIRDLRAPGGSQEFERAVDSMQMGKGVVFESVHRRKSGELFPVEVSVRMLTLDHARYYQGIIRDITERKAAEEALKQSEERFRRAIDEAPVPVMIHNEEGQVIAVNKAWTQISGYSPEEISTIDDWTLKAYPENYLKIREHIHRLFSDRKALQPVEGPIVTKSGEVRVWRFRAASVTSSPDGRRVCITTAGDVTERKAAVDALRTSLREKEALLKEVHHRVKNNLQIVSSLLSLQASQVQDAAILGTLRETQNRVRSMSLLHEALYRSPSLAQVNFATYVNSLCTQLSRTFGTDARRIELVIKVDAVELGMDQAIPCGLIINELVSNALKYAFVDGRPGRIIVALWRSPEGMVQLRVSDNGVGLPKDLDVQKCASLGLQLVFSLAAQIKGTVEVQRNQGTEFCVAFQAPSL